MPLDRLIRYISQKCFLIFFYRKYNFISHVITFKFLLGFFYFTICIRNKATVLTLKCVPCSISKEAKKIGKIKIGRKKTTNLKTRPLQDFDYITKTLNKIFHFYFLFNRTVVHRSNNAMTNARYDRYIGI